MHSTIKEKLLLDKLRNRNVIYETYIKPFRSFADENEGRLFQVKNPGEDDAREDWVRQVNLFEPSRFGEDDTYVDPAIDVLSAERSPRFSILKPGECVLLVGYVDWPLRHWLDSDEQNTPQQVAAFKMLHEGQLWETFTFIEVDELFKFFKRV